MARNILERQIIIIARNINKIKDLHDRIFPYHTTLEGTSNQITQNLQQLYNHGCRNARTQLTNYNYSLFKSFFERFSVTAQTFMVLSGKCTAVEVKFAQTPPADSLHTLTSASLTSCITLLNTIILDLDQILIDYEAVTTENPIIIHAMNTWTEEIIRTTVFNN